MKAAGRMKDRLTSLALHKATDIRKGHPLPWVKGFLLHGNKHSKMYLRISSEKVGRSLHFIYVVFLSIHPGNKNIDFFALN